MAAADALPGAPDIEEVTLAITQDRVLITEDKDSESLPFVTLARRLG